MTFHRKAFTLIELIVVIVLILAMIAMLLPAIHSGKGMARKMQCANHLKQITLAFHNYHDNQGSFPPAYIIDHENLPLYSWRVALLPFVEMQNLYDQFRLEETWDSEHNIVLFEQRPTSYQCPRQYRFEGQPGDCPYAMIIGQVTISDGPNAIKLSEITDGTPNTILVAETRKHIPWSSPTDISFDSLGMGVMNQNDPKALLDGICSRHKTAGVNVAFADGSVRVVSPQIKPEMLQFMATINGGEKIDVTHLSKP